MQNSQGKRKSTFIESETLPSDSYFDFWSGDQNYKISSANFMSELGVTGSIEQLGDATAVPILDIQGSVNRIRNIETPAGSGLQSSVSTDEGCELALDAQSTGDGVAVLNDSNEIRRVKAGNNVTLSLDGDDIVIDSTPGTFMVDQEVGITAHPGGGQANAYQLTARTSVIETCASAGDSVKLPQALVVGDERTVMMNTVNNPNVFPYLGDTILNAGASPNAFVQLLGTYAGSYTFYCYEVGKWLLKGAVSI